MQNYKRLSIAVTFMVALLLPFSAVALDIVSQPVAEAPLLDGTGFDAAWQTVKPIAIKDHSGTIILLRSVHTDDSVYFLAQFQDLADNLLHKPWVWDKEKNSYALGPHREDTFVFKWNMMDHPVNLSNFSDDDYRADVWYWKANRTNPAGYADDKTHLLGSQSAKKATVTSSPAGKQRYLQRISDAGKAPYTEYEPADFERDIVDHYNPVAPDGSRGDVHAKGNWVGGIWTIEFERKLNTGHEDDVQFDLQAKTPYLFGVSMFSLYGKPHDPDSPNFYGRGKISEPLYLSLK